MKVKNFDPFRYWYWCKKLRAAVCVPAKCGSTAAAYWLFDCPSVGSLQKHARVGKYGPYSPAEIIDAKPDGEHFLVVRDPVERFASLWRNKCRDGMTPNGIAEIHNMTPGELMDHIESHPFGDPHWFPQSFYLTPAARPIWLDELFMLAGVDATPRNGTTKRKGDPELPIDRIREHYKKDCALWISIQTS